MSQNTRVVFVDADNLPSIPIQLQLGETLAFYRQITFGGEFLHLLILPKPHFSPPQPWPATLAGQPADTDLVGVGCAQTKGSVDIIIQFSPPHPASSPHAPVYVPVTIS